MPSVCSKVSRSSTAQESTNDATPPRGSCRGFKIFQGFQESASDLSDFLVAMVPSVPTEAFKELTNDAHDSFAYYMGLFFSEPTVVVGVVASLVAMDAIVPTGPEVSQSMLPSVVVTAEASEPEPQPEEEDELEPAQITSTVQHVQGPRSSMLPSDEARAAPVSASVAQQVQQEAQPPGVAAGTTQENQSLLSLLFPHYFPDSILMKISCVQIGAFAATICASSLALGTWTFFPSACCLYHLGASWGPAIAAGNIARLVTPIFLHASVSHLVFNVIFQCRLGFAVERALGSRNFAGLYFLSGVLGNMVSAAVEPWKLAVGASTSALGVLGANGVLQIINWHSIPPEARVRTVFLFGLYGSAFAMSASTGADVYGHLGGFLAGACISVLAIDRLAVTGSPWEHKWSYVVAGALTVAGTMIMWSGQSLVDLPVDPSQTSIEEWCPYSWDWALALIPSAESIGGFGI